MPKSYLRSSLTKAAVNKGYGMVKIHPEYLMQGPYGTKKTTIASRGGKRIRPYRARKNAYNRAALVGCGNPLFGMGYDTAALDGMGYDTAALDGMGYDTAALDGMGYDTAAIQGYGIFSTIKDLIGALAKAIGGEGMSAIKMISEKLHESVEDLVKEPEKLIPILKKVAPHIGKRVQKFYSWIKGKKSKPKKSPEEEEQEKMKERLAWLKEMDPMAYQRMYQRLQQQAWEKYRAQMLGPYASYTNPYVAQSTTEVPSLTQQQYYSSQKIRSTRPMPAYTREYDYVEEPTVMAAPVAPTPAPSQSGIPAAKY